MVTEKLMKNEGLGELQSWSYCKKAYYLILDW